MDLMNIIKTRRSIRKYSDRTVADDIIKEAIEAASYSPNGGNYQGWRFLVIKKKDLINKIADAVMEKMEMLDSWPESDEFRAIFDRYKKNAVFFKEAPVCIAVFSENYKGVVDKVLYAREEKNDPEASEMIDNRNTSKSGLQTIGGAVENMLLMLHSRGLGACWMTGPTIAKKEIELLLPPQRGMDFVTFIPVGYPAETKDAPPRKPVSEITQFIE